MTEYKAAINGYAVSSEVKKIIFEEGYVALRIIPEESASIKICETVKIKGGNRLPQGADTILAKKVLCDYNTLIVIEKNFSSFVNVVTDFS
ncbi:MAG: hypothetical protein VR72_10660 [Clostridiaceae bacterium BRH_c20a]|nr:MAG: hypothetical protein VR72_10660 [Clostridiaceae bacterium BRH_c20a]